MTSVISVLRFSGLSIASCEPQLSELPHVANIEYLAMGGDLFVPENGAERVKPHCKWAMTALWVLGCSSSKAVAHPRKWTVCDTGTNVRPPAVVIGDTPGNRAVRRQGLQTRPVYDKGHYCLALQIFTFHWKWTVCTNTVYVLVRTDGWENHTFTVSSWLVCPWVLRDLVDN